MIRLWRRTACINLLVSFHVRVLKLFSQLSKFPLRRGLFWIHAHWWFCSPSAMVTRSSRDYYNLKCKIRKNLVPASSLPACYNKQLLAAPGPTMLQRHLLTSRRHHSVYLPYGMTYFKKGWNRRKAVAVQVMKAYKATEVEVWLRPCLSSALNGLTPVETGPSIQWTGGWVVCRGGLDALREKTNPRPLPGMESWIVHPVALPLQGLE